MAQRKAFRNATRSNDNRMLMYSIVKDMTDEELEVVANYIATLH
ncbi:MAG: hypothetical protein PVG45_09225 [Gammaproteobacteria bacterium]